MVDDSRKSKQELLQELEEARARIAKLEGDIASHEEGVDSKAFGDLFEAMDSPAAFLGTDLRYKALNLAYDRYLGFSRDLLIGQTPASIVGEKGYESDLKPQLQRCLRGETVFFSLWIEYQGMGKRLMAISYIPRADHNGNLIGVLLITRDITDTYHLELESSIIMETAMNGFWTGSRDGTILSANKAVADMLGTTRQALVGRKVWDIKGTEDPDMVRRRIDGLFAAGGGRFETLMCRDDGAMIDVDVSVTCTDHQGGRFYSFLRDMSAYKATERELRESEARFKALHDASFGGIAIHDKGVILDCNQGLVDISGFSREELIGMDGLLLIAPGSREQVMANILSGYEKAYEVYGIRKSGEEYPLRLEARNIPYKGKRVRTVEFRDITESRQAREALEESHARLHSVVMNMPVMLNAFDEHDRLVFWNRECERVTGYSCEEAMRSGSILSLLFPDKSYREDVARKIREAMGEFRNLELDLTCKNGGIRTISWSSASRKAPIPGWNTWAVGVDVTEQRKAERALRESEQKHKSVIDNIQDVYYRTDHQGRLILLSPSCAKMLGYDNIDALLGKQIESFYFEPEQRDKFLDILESRGSVSNYEVRLKKLDGTPLDVSTNSAFHYDDAGNVLGVEGVFRDVTEIKRAERIQAAFTAFVRNSNDIILIKDRDRRVVATNMSFAKACGHSDPSEFIGMTDAEIFGIPETMDPVKGAMLDDLQALELSQGEFIEREEVLVFRDGKKRVSLTRKYPIFDDSGELFAIGVISTDITQRKETERKITESESRFRSLFDYAGEGIFLVDKDSNIREANQAAAIMLGYDSPAEIVGMSAREIIHLDDYEERSPEINYLRARSEDVVRFERRYRRKNGSYLPVQVAVKNMKDTGLNHVLFSDISERKRVEEALQTRIVALTQPLEDASELTFEALFDLEDIQRIQDEFAQATGVASIITRPDGTPITVPSNFSNLCGDIIRRAPEGLENCKRSDVLTGEGLSDQPRILRCLSGGLLDAGAIIDVGGKHLANWLVGQVRDESQGEEGMREYARQIGADEEETVQAFREVPVMSRERFLSIARALHTLAKQISMLAYQNLQQARFIQAKARAEERNKLLAELLNASDTVAVYKDTSLNYKMVNREYLKLTGLQSFEEVLGRNDAQLLDGMATEEQISQYIDNDRIALALPRGEIYTIEEYLSGEGEDRVFLTKKFPIFDEEHVAAVGVATLTSEITELKRIEMRLLQEKSRAEAASAAKTEFLANMSHEIRTPLNGIVGMLNLLQNSILDREQREYANNALASCMRLTSLLSDILDVSAVESGKLRLSMGAVNLKDLLDSVDSLFGLTASQKNVSLVMTRWPGVPDVILGDELRLRQILFNLVGNGLKFTESGGVHVELAPLRVRDEPCGRVLFMVTDTGPGIMEEHYEEVFQVFGQADHGFDRKHQGAGLGLPIVKRLVDLMGGTICLESHQGKGSVFYVSIPVGRAPLDLPVAKPSAGVALDPGRDRKTSDQGLEILIAEDERINMLALSRLLRKGGHEVTAVEDGAKAVEALKQGRFDLVIMDIQMPNMDGLAATRAHSRGTGRRGQRGDSHFGHDGLRHVRRQGEVPRSRHGRLFLQARGHQHPQPRP